VASLNALKSFPLTPSVVNVAAFLVPRLAIRTEEVASRANIVVSGVLVISYGRKGIEQKLFDVDSLLLARPIAWREISRLMRGESPEPKSLVSRRLVSISALSSSLVSARWTVTLSLYRRGSIAVSLGKM
jgi:hypothetical protein